MSTTYKFRDREFRFNDHVVAEMMIGVAIEDRTGRLVQVRVGTGPFGTDQYFIRRRDQSLMCFANVLLRHVGDKGFEDAFYRGNGNEPPAIPEQPAWDGDTEATEYSLSERYPETGFLIEKPRQPDDPQQSFGMIVTKGGS